ncbi:MAG TPA: hypothetical protein VFS43_11670 [Polyangiaceae bacterium]|nr:hypothetical protein [Polyangiaceae bacterium]
MADTPVRLRSCWGAWASACLALGVAACSPEAEGAPGDEAPAATHAYFTVERARDADDDGVRTQVSARFLRLQEGSDPRVAAELVGAITEPPSRAGCQPLGASGSRLALGGLTPVELARAGDVAVESSNRPTHLTARAYPDVAHLVSGVVYTSPEVASDVPADATSITFQVAAGERVPALRVTVPMPRGVDDLRVNGMPLRAAVATALGRAPITFTWSNDEGKTFLDVAAVEAGGAATRWRCVGDREGALALPASIALTASALEVTAHHLTVSPFQAEALAGGQVQFDTTTSGRLPLADGGE